MPFAYAFKDAAEAARRSSGLEAAFSLEIARVTGGRFSHVECWISGSLDAALCFSSREPAGTALRIIDLSDPALWIIVPVATTPVQDVGVRGFCMGSSGRRYDGLGLVGIDLQTGFHDPFDRFCSESGFELGQMCLGIFPHDIDRWMVAPSGGHVRRRYGLYELLTDANPAAKA